jgi:hypothetical protein
MDSLNAASLATMATVSDRQVFGAQVVSKTLDYAHAGSASGMGSGMSQTYDFSKDVLGAYASGKGALADFNV